MCFPQLLGHATSSATADEGFAFLTSSLTTLLSCRFRSGNPYRCNVLLFFWIIFSQLSVMSPRCFSCARWLFVYLLQGNAYLSLSPIVIEVVNDCVDPSHGYLVGTHSLTVSFARYHLKLGAVQSIFSFVADVKQNKTKRLPNSLSRFPSTPFLKRL